MSVLKSQLEITANADGVEAGFAKAKRSINSFGTTVNTANSSASKSIDKYVKKLEQQNAMHGMSARETELYKLSLRGASDAQLKAADSAIKLSEGYERGEKIGNRFKIGIAAIAAATAAAAVAAYSFVNSQAEQISKYQEIGEKIGDTAVAVASLQKASDVSGVSLDTVAAASIRLTSALAKTDDEGTAAGKAISALGLNLEDFKKLSPVDQIEAVSKALDGFQDGAGKTAVMTALFGKAGAELLPIMNDLAGAYGRQTKLTEEQIRTADEYSKKLAAAKSDLNALAQQIASAALPALLNLTEAFASGSDKADDLKKGVKDLTGLSLADWFDSVAVGAAGFVDQLRAAAGIMDVLRAHAELGSAKASRDFNLLGSGSIFKSDETLKAEKAELAKREAAVVAARANLDAARQTGQKLAASPFASEVQRRIDERKSSAALEKLGRKLGNDSISDGKKELDTSGLGTGGKKGGDGASELKARLASDVGAIKNASDLLVNTYSNAEKVMEAQRSAGLLGDKEYYESKRGFIRLESEAKEDALRQEIARLQQERAAGKDRIDNDKKIAEAQSKIAILRANSAAQLDVLGIQEQSAAVRLKAAFLSAKQAAQDYFDTTQKQQSRDLESAGMGTRQRNFNAGVNQIEDKYSGQRRDLENQKAQLELEGKFTDEARTQYENRLAIINEFQDKSIASFTDYYSKLIKQQGDWTLGASTALKNYADESQNTMAQTEKLFTNAFQGMEDALVNFVTTGKLSFGDLAKSILADLARIQIKSMLSGILGSGKDSGGGLFSMLGGLFGGGGGSGLGSIGGGLSALASAKGNAFANGRVSAFANGGAFTNGIATGPTLAPMALFGEAGPEAIMPLTRASDGSLGVRTSGGSSPSIHYAPVISIDSRTDRNEVYALVEKAVKQGNAQLVDRLQRGGRL